MYNKEHSLFQFFNVPCSNAYELCDETHQELASLEEQYLRLKDSAELFVLNSPSNQKLVLCRSDLKSVKVTPSFKLDLL